ncbi:uncharacterized protein LOC129793703 [Lutzomyia longipalpis]|uniref:Uncharacterized protein n=1 Tax=Lutzomyia longipalpis TaxID=7200 RepID=A0A1B0GIZ2_LUTLO|nr:uncharacterized protein LOC129793703 [Lutzomyia longipalpis]
MLKMFVTKVLSFVIFSLFLLPHFDSASAAPSVMINSHGTIISETGADSTNNQNGFNEDSFDEVNVGLKVGAFLGGVAVPLQGAAPIPVTAPGAPGFVAVPQGTVVAIPGVPVPQPGHIRVSTGQALNANPTSILTSAIAVNKLPLDIKLHGDLKEEAAAKATVIEEETIAADI